MIEKNVDGVTFLEFDLFESSDWLRHCFSTRIGGVSEGPFLSMNFRTNGDSQENVTENYRIICEAARLSFDGVTLSVQEHGTNIKVMTHKEKGSGLHKECDYGNIDALITNEPGITLSTFHADCAAIFLADPVSKAIGLSHAGWRGTLDRIAAKTIEEMTNRYGTKPENIIAGIGPSICYSCFEVDRPVYELFKEFSEHTKPIPGAEDKHLIDLKSINSDTLLNMGVKKNRIEVSPLCTKCDAKLFYSHRRDGNIRGSMAAFMEIIG